MSTVRHYALPCLLALLLTYSAACTGSTGQSDASPQSSTPDGRWTAQPAQLQGDSLLPLRAVLGQGERCFLLLRITGDERETQSYSSGKLRTLTLTLTDPNGGTYSSTIPLTKDCYINSMGSSILIGLEEDQVQVYRGEYVQTEQIGRATWGVKTPDLHYPGRWQVQASAHVVGNGAVTAPTFSMPKEAAVFTRDKRMPAWGSEAKLRQQAKAFVAQHAPQLAISDVSMPIIQDAHGPVVLLCAQDGGWDRALFTLRVGCDQTGQAQWIAQHRTDGCLAPNSMVMTASGPKALTEVELGDRIRSLDPQSLRRCWVDVLAIRYAPSLAVVNINNGQLRLTANHPVRIGEQWCQAAALSLGDSLVREDRQQEAIYDKTWEQLQEVDMFIDLSVSDPHCFLVNGVLVHNKSRSYSPDLDDIAFRLWPRPKRVTLVYPK